MGVHRSSSSRSILVLLLATVFLIFYWYKVDSSIPAPVAVKAVKMSSDSADVTSKLKVTVRQVGTPSPPKLALAVTNKHSGPVTVLSWNSPLDPLAVQLGLISLTPAGSDGPVQIPTIQVRRRMPPGPESLVTIGAGQTKEQQLELKAPMVPLDELRGRASVVCKGEWMSIWLAETNTVPKDSLENAGASEDAFRGPFQSETVDIEL
ncbi:hypothetical protein GGR54DRAFT_610043 [Hypoxylon sp. NC1633]|nr:hypothetical protein GGR54DRAFT_610043 [Hypoxylon sp. NC1633]